MNDLDAQTRRKYTSALVLTGFAAGFCLLYLALIAIGFTRPSVSGAAVAPPPGRPVAAKVLHCTGFDFEIPGAAWQRYDLPESPQSSGAVLGFRHITPFTDFSVVMPTDLPADLSAQSCADTVKRILANGMAEFNVVDEGAYAIHGTPGIRLRLIGTASSPDEPEMYGVLWFSQWNGQHYGLRVAGAANNATEVNAAAEEMFEHFHPHQSAK